MAQKKVRFPLIMEEGKEVRDLKDLKDNFSLPRVLEYMKEGKLVTWLRDRYEDDLADKIESIDNNDQMARNICEAFDVQYDETIEDGLKKAGERIKRVERLKKYTDKDEYIKEIDRVAFDQDEMYDLLDEGCETIYLCGESFSIPLSKNGVSYVGVNNPIVFINSNEKVDWDAKQISLTGVVFDEKYSKIQEQSEAVYYSNHFGSYEETYLTSMLGYEERLSVKNTFTTLAKEIEKLWNNDKA